MVPAPPAPTVPAVVVQEAAASEPTREPEVGGQVDPEGLIRVTSSNSCAQLFKGTCVQLSDGRFTQSTLE